MAYSEVNLRYKRKVIDTCSPGGNWINEKRYNRQRPTGQTSRKVLCGNWYEERELENDLLEVEHQRRLSRCDNAASLHAQSSADVAHGGVKGVTRVEDEGVGSASSLSAAHGSRSAGAVSGDGASFAPHGSQLYPTASLDTIWNNGHGRYKGGLNSTPYIMRDVHALPSEPGRMRTAYKQDYNSRTSDVRALARPELGVRSQLLLHRFLDTAMSNVTEREQQRAREAEQRSSKIRMADIRSSANFDDSNMASVYAVTMGSQNKERKVIHEIRNDYLCDEPITIYTGNPYTGKTMVVHGKTPVDELGSSRFGKHTHFSKFKYAL